MKHNILLKPGNIYLRMTSLVLLIFFSMKVSAQQHIITQKDNTRPETAKQFNSFNLSSFQVLQNDGYNEVQWQAGETATSNKFVVEYSFDGINFIRGEQVTGHNGLYNYRHYIRDTRPLLYRVSTENGEGSWVHSGAIMPKGVTVLPVQLQGNMIRGNMINVQASFPVERLTIVSTSGVEVFAKDLNGARDLIPVAIPSLKEGIYFVNFFGNGWKSTSRFVIG